jgi:hypothetical protein
VSEPERISLPTVTGAVQLQHADTSRQCIGCRVRGGGLLDVEATSGRETAGFAICGNCLSSSIATYLRFKSNIGSKKT